MKTDLTDTTASKINKALVKARRAIGTPAVGMVLTLVIVTDEENAYDALKSANDASREHPSRTIVVIKRVSRSPRDRTKSRLDAEVRVGADAGTDSGAETTTEDQSESVEAEPMHEAKAEDGGCVVSQPGSHNSLASAALFALASVLLSVRRRRAF